MKKMLILIVLITMICGCSTNESKYKDFKHYDLSKYNHRKFEYVRNNASAWYDIEKEEYAVAVLTESSEDILGYEEGLLYKINDNNYIILDNFMGCSNCYDSDEYTYLYEDKLYILRLDGAGIYEYTLNKENTQKRELKFNFDSIFDNYRDLNPVKYLCGYTIDYVNDSYIYFKGAYIYNIVDLNLSIKCSLEDLKCTLGN